MLTDENIIYFGPERWSGLWRNRHHLMSRFAKYNKVMYVEPKVSFGQLRRSVQRRNPNRIGFRPLITRELVTRVADNMYIYNSPVFTPISGRFPLDKLTMLTWKLLLRSTMSKLGFNKPIIWLSRPKMLNLIGNFNEKLVIYHVVDEYLAYGNINAEDRLRLQNIEQRLLMKADLVIVVSSELFEAKRKFNEHTYIVPNAVDYQAYQSALSSHKPSPPDIAQLPRPIIGYSGLISKRLDLSLLEHIAHIHPEWSIVLIGAINKRGCEADFTRLQLIKNLHFLGQKNIQEVPFYVMAFDVCLVPYRINEQTKSLSPLKLYDYMATGKPIVATDFPAARHYKDLVYIARSSQSLCTSIESALAPEDERLINQRRRIAAENTWEDRVNQISFLIESFVQIGK